VITGLSAKLVLERTHAKPMSEPECLLLVLAIVQP
jgi:hypothetical protein